MKYKKLCYLRITPSPHHPITPSPYQSLLAIEESDRLMQLKLN
ncbi:MAG: hypothetical protein QNJ74_01260 [Trichodesmium sp. MO_231.B1]|nr:hypothetical protein [Trichodesmium sp. MO_231.B1]